ncbi:NAD(P)/FAD-dependent oxidoreductase [Pedococcus sp. 5OH_020]|uniref:NAD(P)/FAD-dependent oxidoreductase n=1 Tax=Pedococcus sp. 5OH_020 TaxID=2989814 RepID=UPI0022E9F951|nr:FAD-dependent oxidoreductase [Pedococcus sp. 5OH_020]
MGTPTAVIVGAGLAGAKTAEALRDHGFDGRIRLLGQEPHRPYERPPLSKQNLTAGHVEDGLYVHPTGWYAEHDVDLRTGCRVERIDLRARELGTSAGQLGWDVLVLATGSSPRRIAIPGSDLSGVHYLRTLEDSNALHARLQRRPDVVIVGGGWVGLEVAAAAATTGASVTVLEQARLPMEAILGERLARFLVAAHRGHGVQVRSAAKVAAFTSNGRRQVSGVRLADGTVLQADLVVVGIGAVPQTELAAAAGLAVDNGVVVDDHLRTGHPDVYAVGDLANAYHPTLKRRLRVEHWANALNQPQTVGAAVTGQDEPYDRLPYFFSDQYDLGLEYMGHLDPSLPHDVVVRGDEQTGTFLGFWVQRGRLAAGLAVNSWGALDEVEPLIRSGRQVSLAELADPDVPLGQLGRRPVRRAG